MDEMQNESPRPVNPRRRPRSKMQMFKEAYLPYIIAGVALVLIVIFIIGSISRAVQVHNAQKAASIASANASSEAKARLDQEAEDLLKQAAELATQYNYSGAVAAIDSFSGTIADYPDLVTKRAEYAQLKDTTTVWSDPSQITCLSFQLLIADPARAFNNEDYGAAYNRNFVTIGEFQSILQQLYDNGYVLVGFQDFVTTTTDDAGKTVYAAKPIYLPKDKKPLMLFQTNVNYNTYMIDSDDDGLPDAGGAGFASRLVVGSDGKITCEMVDATGATVTGAYDLVPILDAFIAAHPDFSYNGAKATLALTGYDGLFGYRTNTDSTGENADYYNEQVEGAKKIISALRADGYVFACYTYGNVGYGDYTAEQITDDLSDWNSEVVPLLGKTDVLVYAQNSELASYVGSPYEALKNAGFRYYLGFCSSGLPSASITDEYVWQGRILVTGSNMAHSPEWFTGMFDPASVLDTTRGDIPE